MWSDVSKLTFAETSRTPDIEIRFVRGDHGDGYPFNGPGGVLAHAFYPNPAFLIAGDAHFDEDETWTHRTSAGLCSVVYSVESILQCTVSSLTQMIILKEQIR